jgi:UDP:flavonoid glycosyltransferase YjiC (YdhE family)
MKFIVCPFGSYGDLNPFVGLSLALKARGHEPTLFACGYFREMIERHGLSFRELGTAEEYLKASEHPDLWHPLRGFPHIFHHGKSCNANATGFAMRPAAAL